MIEFDVPKKHYNGRMPSALAAVSTREYPQSHFTLLGDVRWTRIFIRYVKEVDEAAQFRAFSNMMMAVKQNHFQDAGSYKIYRAIRYVLCLYCATH